MGVRSAKTLTLILTLTVALAATSGVFFPGALASAYQTPAVQSASGIPSRGRASRARPKAALTPRSSRQPPARQTLANSWRERHAPVIAEYPQNEVLSLLKEVTHKRKKCDAYLRKVGHAGGLCAEVKVLVTLEVLLKSYLTLEQKYDFLTGKSQFLTAENLGLRKELMGLRMPASVEENSACYKPRLLHELMADEGIYISGNTLFSKLPNGTMGTCWTNSRKKKEATITLCDYPLAVYFKTVGGTGKAPVIRERQYIFDLKGCNLVVVDVNEQSVSGKKETFLNYDHCLEEWNKRTADATMNTKQVRLMEDTIGACFRYHLLPPRNVEGGRTNPNLPPPPGDRPTVFTPTGP